MNNTSWILIMSMIENPIILRKIRLRKIGIIEDFTINFTHPLQIFWGRSGAGKTTLLNAIHHIRYGLPLNKSEELSSYISSDSLIQCLFAPESFQLSLDVKDFQITISYDDFIIEPSNISMEELSLNNLFMYFSIENFGFYGSSIDPYKIDYYEFDKKLSIGQNWYNYLLTFLEKKFLFRIILLDDVLAFLDDKHANNIIDSLMNVSNFNQIIFTTSHAPISLTDAQEKVVISGFPNDQAWFNEKLRQLIHKETSIYVEFKNSIQVIKNLMKIELEDPDLQQRLLYLFHINIITTMEAFFTDILIKSVHNDKIIQKRLLRESKEFNEKKYKLKESIEIFENLDNFIEETLLKTSFHEIWKVKDLYKKVLNVDFPEDLDDIIKAVNIRHIIVHRNGKNAEGSNIIIKSNDIYNLIAQVEFLVDFIKGQLPFE